MTVRGALPRSDVLGTRVTACTFAEAVDALVRRVEEGEPAVFSSATVHSVVTGRREPSFRELVNAADLVLTDGVPLVWAARRHRPEAERVHGDDLLLHVVRGHPHWRHYFLGGGPGQAAEVVRRLRDEVPGISVAGWRSTPVRPLPPEERTAVLEEVRGASPEIVWVGMGTPHQDRWMAAHRGAVGVPLVGVGSAFDLLTGRKAPTPGWLQRAGLQWAHRLAQEPRRLARRYAVDNTLFLLHFGRQLLAERGMRRGRRAEGGGAGPT